MNAEPIKLWIKALRSGDYDQGKRTLYDSIDDTYCCLGVACRIFPDSKPNYLDHTPNNLATAIMPEKVAEWLGISPSQGSLSRANDRGRNFKEIADVIEEALENDPDDRGVIRCQG